MAQLKHALTPDWHRRSELRRLWHSLAYNPAISRDRRADAVLSVKSIVPDKLRTGSALGSDDAYRELHSVKVLMSCNTAKPPESEREYSTCLTRQLKSVRMMSPSLSISRSC